MKDGLYRVVTDYLCAGFVVERGRVIRCAPILRAKINYWMTKAVWIACLLCLLCGCREKPASVSVITNAAVIASYSTNPPMVERRVCEWQTLDAYTQGCKDGLAVAAEVLSLRMEPKNMEAELVKRFTNYFRFRFEKTNEYDGFVDGIKVTGQAGYISNDAFVATGDVFRIPVTPRKQTYTVKTPVWETTNAVEVIQNHEPSCTLIRYVQHGQTNEFHAWLVPVVVTTNK